MSPEKREPPTTFSPPSWDKTVPNVLSQEVPGEKVANANEMTSPPLQFNQTVLLGDFSRNAEDIELARMEQARAEKGLTELRQLDAIASVTGGRQHHQLLQLLSQRKLTLYQLKILATSTDEENQDKFVRQMKEVSRTDSAVLLSLLPYVTCKRLHPKIIGEILPRLLQEMECDFEAISMEAASGLLRLAKEFHRGGYFIWCKEEFEKVYTAVKRLSGSVKLSRMQGGLGVVLKDLKEILACEFAPG